MSDRRQTVDRMARLAIAFGFADVLGRHIDTLSGGQKQRVALARAALKSSVSMIVLDEPTHMLDGDSKIQAFAALRDIAEEDGVALIIVSHDTEAQGIATRTIRIADGTIQQDERSAVA
ncbi:MAG TPA: ATP-binding cassette domain-containing protein, partial [Candidatus Saccharimonadales bacterium]